MLRHFLIGILIGVFSGAAGCARPGLVLRNERGTVPVVHPQRVRPVEYAKDDLQDAIAPYSGHLARVVQERDSRLRLRLASDLGTTNAVLQPEVDAYLGWCGTRGEPGDCLEVLDERAPGLSIDAKRTIALRIALASGLQEAADAIRDVNPIRIEALLVIWFTGYLATLVIPEVVTKVVFVVMTANPIAFLGFDGFHSIIEGYRTLRDEAAAAQTFVQLQEAGERYGRRMGPSVVRIVTALGTWGVSGATGMARPVSGLPGAAQAAVNARAHGFHLAAVNGGSVSVSTSGAVTLVLAAEATVSEGGAPALGERRAASNPEAGRYDTEHGGPRGFDHARENAIRNAGDLGPKTQKMYDPKTGTLIGEMSANGKRGWRLDDDHFNWWDWTGGKKGHGGRYGHEFFPPDSLGLTQNTQDMLRGSDAR